MSPEPLAIERTASSLLRSSRSTFNLHCPIVPIFDSNTQAAISQFVDRELVCPIREAIADLPEWARAYRNFVAAIVVLHGRAHAETPLKPTVKELDHMLC
jgi:hypothetical protein